MRRVHLLFDCDLRRITSVAVPSPVFTLTPVGAAVVWNLSEEPAMTAVGLTGCLPEPVAVRAREGTVDEKGTAG